MAVQGRVAQADNGAIGFDTTVPLNSATANTYFSQNFRFCVRYVSRDDAGRQYNAANGSADLSEPETSAIMQSGLALMVVQHVEQTHPTLFAVARCLEAKQGGQNRGTQAAHRSDQAFGKTP